MPDSNPEKVVCTVYPCISTGKTSSTHELWKHLESCHKLHYSYTCAKGERDKFRTAGESEGQEKLAACGFDSARDDAEVPS